MQEDTVHFDFETRSAAKFGKGADTVTAYQYARHPTTGLWCLSYAFNDEPVRNWRLGERFPGDVVDALREGWTFAGHNVAFEWCIWNFLLVPSWGFPPLPFEQTDCTATRASVMALPRTLSGAGKAMQLDIQKDEEGAKLMQRMAKPRKPRKGEDPDGLYWWDDAERLDRLVAYCDQDVEAERALDKVLRPLSADERRRWHLSHKANFHGVQVDIKFVQRASRVMVAVSEHYNSEISRLTAGEVQSVTEVQGIKNWLGRQGVEAESLDKTSVIHLLEDPTVPEPAKAVLHLRQEAGKSSVAKLNRFHTLSSEDHRMRENFLHHGAATGRLAGKGAQLQNLPSRGGLKWYEAEQVIDLVMSTPDPLWAAQRVELIHGPVPTAISSCLRACLVVPPPKALFVADYSNIEGRVAAWLGNEQWKLDAFRAYDTVLLDDNGAPLRDAAGEVRRAGPDLYKVTAGQILGRGPEHISGSERNVMGKVPELALGFQGGVGAFQSMAQIYNVDMAAYWPQIQKALDHIFIDRAWQNWESYGAKSGMFVDAWIASEAVKLAWRARHPGLVRCWYDAEECAKNALRTPRKWFRFAGGRCGFASTNYGGVPFLISELPSGRRIYRAHARLSETRKNGRSAEVITFMGVDSTTHQWVRMTTYGGDLFQSYVQGIAADVMWNGWQNVEADGFDVVLSVHDELGAESDMDRPLEDFVTGMERLPAWADGLPVSAAGYKAHRYRKD